MWRLILLYGTLYALSAYAQPISLGLIGGAGLTQDFQNYDLPPIGEFGVLPPYGILGSSTPERWIAGGTLEVRLSRHFAVEADGLYHELQFRLGIQYGQMPSQLNQRQHVVTWEFPVLVKYGFRLPFFPVVKPFINAGPTFRVLGNLSHTNPSAHGVAAGLGVEAHLWRLRMSPQFRYLRWARDQNVPAFGLTTVTDQVEFLTAITFP